MTHTYGDDDVQCSPTHVYLLVQWETSIQNVLFCSNNSVKLFLCIANNIFKGPAK